MIHSFEASQQFPGGYKVTVSPEAADIIIRACMERRDAVERGELEAGVEALIIPGVLPDQQQGNPYFDGNHPFHHQIETMLGWYSARSFDAALEGDFDTAFERTIMPLRNDRANEQEPAAHFQDMLIFAREAYITELAENGVAAIESALSPPYLPVFSDAPEI